MVEKDYSFGVKTTENNMSPRFGHTITKSNFPYVI